MTPELEARLAQIRRGEIPVGYKRVKFGIVPESWSDCRLASFCNMKSGNGITSASIASSGQFPCYGGNGLRGYTDTFTHSGRYILIGRVGALCGNVLLVEGKFFASEHALVTQCNEHASVDFCYHLFDYMNLNRYSEASAQPVLTVQKLLKLKAPLPPFEEQRNIAAVLSAQDSVITLKERLITEKQRQKKGLIQRLFQKFHGEKRKMKDICEILGGGTPDTRKTEYWNGEILWCTPSDFSKNGTKYVNCTEKRISQLGLQSSSATMLPVGAVLLCTRATVGEARIASLPMCTNQGFQSMIANPGISNEWLYYLIQHIKNDIIKLASGSTFLEISKTNFSNIVISVPSLENQLKIAEILSAADREIDLLQQGVAQERRRKKALSQLLLTGLVRTHDG